MTNPIASILAVEATRDYAQSALPCAPTAPERPPRHRAPATRRAVASGLRWAASRLEPAV
jgi:hypothetical protein